MLIWGMGACAVRYQMVSLSETEMGHLYILYVRCFQGHTRVDLTLITSYLDYDVILFLGNN